MRPKGVVLASVLAGLLGLALSRLSAGGFLASAHEQLGKLSPLLGTPMGGALAALVAVLTMALIVFAPPTLRVLDKGGNTAVGRGGGWWPCWQYCPKTWAEP